MVSGATCGEFYHIGEPHEITRCNLVGADAMVTWFLVATVPVFMS